MANPGEIPGGTTEAEASDLVRGFTNLFELCTKSAEGDELAKSTLGIFENMLQADILTLEAQQNAELLRRHITPESRA